MNNKMTIRLLLVLLSAFPLAASDQIERDSHESGSVWIWSDPETLEEAVAVLISKVEIDEVDQTATLTESKVYIESPQSNRAEVTFSYNPETAGFDLVFRDSMTGWKAEIERGFIFDDEDILPISQ